MARRRSRNSSNPVMALAGWFFKTRTGRQTLVVVNVLILAVGTGWYFMQPPERQAEIRLLVGNYVDREKQVRLPELAWDLWQYYYGNQFVTSEFRGGDGMVYGGIPDTGGTGAKIRVLENRGYVAGYADVMKNPLWVAYRLFDQADLTRPEERPDGFDVDNRTFSRVSSSDYTGSGYDRGHLAPNYGIALCYGREAQLETFLMSNIIPQRHGLNAGPWKELEMKAAVNYPARFREIWVIAGPVFDKPHPVTPGGIPIPSSCYKIMIDETGGQVRVQAFLMPQEVIQGAAPEYYLSSVDEIEALTGIDFLPELEDAVEDALEARVPSRIW